MENASEDPAVKEEKLTLEEIQKQNEDFEIIQLQKSGSIRIPKGIRDTLPEPASFAFWTEENRLIFQLLTTEELVKLKIEKEAAQKTKKPKTTKAKQKKLAAIKVEPELTKYFPFQFENQNDVKEILESTFYVLMAKEIQLEEAIERLKYGIIKYATGKSTNDSRLKHSYILFISDVLQKNKSERLDPLIDFAYTKILSQISSQFLKEQANIEFFFLSIQRNKNEIATHILHEVLQGIEIYTETYAIMQGFKNLVKPIEIDEIIVPSELKLIIGSKIKDFIHGFKVEYPDSDKPPIIHSQPSTDKALQLIEFLIAVRLIEDAYHETEELLSTLPPEDMYIDRVRETFKKLKDIRL